MKKEVEKIVEGGFVKGLVVIIIVLLVNLGLYYYGYDNIFSRYSYFKENPLTLLMFAPLLIPLLIKYIKFVWRHTTKRKDRKERKKRHRKGWAWLKKYGLQPILTKMQVSPYRFAKFLLEHFPGLAEAHDPYVEGTIPFVFRSLRAELMILMNYQTRLHTFKGKHGKVGEARDKAEGIEKNFGGTRKTYDELSYIIDNHRIGGSAEEKAKFNITAITPGQPVNIPYGWGNNIEMISLFFNMLKNTLERDIKTGLDGEALTDHYKAPLESTFGALFEAMIKKYGQFYEDAQKFALVHRLRSIKLHILDLLALYGAYKHYYRFAHEDAIFEIWVFNSNDTSDRNPDDCTIDKSGHVVWSLNIEKLLNDTNYIGYRKYQDVRNRVGRDVGLLVEQRKEEELKRKFIAEYIRAHRRTTGETIVSLEIPPRDLILINRKVNVEMRKRRMEIDGEIEAELTTETSRKKIREGVKSQAPLGAKYHMDFVDKIAVQQGTTPVRYEVDLRGFVLEDIHKVEIDHDLSQGYVRRVRIEDIEDFPSKSDSPISNWKWIYENIYKDWDYFIKDLRFGLHHPSSRSDIDYKAIINRRNLNFNNITRTPPNFPAAGAFDLEALAFSGKWLYWGRKNYWDSDVVTNPSNPYPTISTVGLSRFLTDVIRMKAGTNETTRQFLGHWVWDSAGEDDVFTTLVEKGGGRET